MITSQSNAKIRHVQNLNKKAGYRKETGLFTIEGIRMFSELPVDRTEEVFVGKTFFDQCTEETRRKIEAAPFEMVSDAVFESMSDTRTPQGILAVVRQYSYSFADLLKNRAGHNLLILETIQDPGNLGTMMRAGEGAGLSGIIMDRKTADLYNPKVIRSTMGSIFRVPFFYADDLQEAVRSVKNAGITVYAAALDGEKAYDREDYRKPAAFMIGNEAAGLSEEMLGLADIRVRIPMKGKVESLNAAVAASVLMYELARQRRNNGTEN
jgi:TrmH family RNA methyltransferase